MTHEPTQVTEQDVIGYVGEHPDVIRKGFHAAPAGTSKWEAERIVPFLLASFCPATLAREIQAHTGQHARGSTEPANDQDKSGEGARWHVRQLFAIAQAEKASASERLRALEAIRTLSCHCLLALHPQAAEAAAERAHTPANETPWERMQRQNREKRREAAS